VCTLVLAHRHFKGAPLVVAANRDEFLARPASGPRVRGAQPRVLSPRDELAGGTWLGLNEHGLFVGITNRYGAPPDPRRRSRGLLVDQSLRARDSRSLHRELSTLAATEYNPFHLMYADGEAAFVTWSNGVERHQYEVAPGLHVITERSLGADDRGRTELLERLFRAEAGQGAPSSERMRALLAVHGPDGEPLAGSCIHADAMGYGTRSSFVYVSGARPRAIWAEGHPCTAPFAELAEELQELFNGRAPSTAVSSSRVDSRSL
jgi:hypothetical protein